MGMMVKFHDLQPEGGSFGFEVRNVVRHASGEVAGEHCDAFQWRGIVALWANSSAVYQRLQQF